MRLYSFTNMYLSPLQCGLQTAHLVSCLYSNHYTFDDDYFVRWAKDNTIIILNGGNSQKLRELITLFENIGNTYPWASFSEDQQSLDGALTCVGILLPEKIYTAAYQLRTNPMVDIQLSDWEVTLIDTIDTFSLRN